MLKKILNILPTGNKAFTLIELLIVVAVIAIIGGAVFVSLDPGKRFEDARNSNRWTDTTSILDAIKIDQVDNGGTYLASVATTTAGDVYMIGVGTSGCDSQNSVCDTNVSSATSCVDLTGLVTEGYLPDVPVSPNGQGTWNASTTGYTLTRASTGILTIRACESEGASSEIYVAR